MVLCSITKKMIKSNYSAEERRRIDNDVMMAIHFKRRNNSEHSGNNMVEYHHVCGSGVTIT